MSKSKNLVLVFQWHVEDGWYGQNHRAVLEVTPGVGFEKSTDINQFKKDFVSLVKKKHGRNIKEKVTSSRFLIGEKSSFPTYTHCSMGPSYSCSNHEYQISDLKL